MSYETPAIEMSKDNLIRVFHPRILTPSTYLTATVAATGTTLTVASNDGFADKDLVLLEGFNNPLAEIKQLSAGPTLGTSLTIAGVSFAHPLNIGVYRLPFNQVEISGTNTSGGTKTVIATVDINPTSPYTEYLNTGTTYTYYYVRFYNSQATAPYYGAYSDEVAATDLAINSIGAIRRMAFNNLGVKYDGFFTPDWVYDQFFQCEVDVLKAKESWGQMVTYDASLGTVSTGMPSVALPSDIDTIKTNRGVLGIRIANGENLRFIDWKQYQQEMDGVSYTTLATVGSVLDTTLVLTDSADFDDSGNVNIDETEYSYTTNTRSTNTLSGLDALTAEVAAGSHVWQGATFGEPSMYSINNGYVYFDVPVDADLVDRTIWCDYFKTAVRPNSDGDTISFNDPVMYVKYLEMAIKKRKGNGVIKMDDDSYVKFEACKKQLALRDKSPYTSRIIPVVPDNGSYY